MKILETNAWRHRKIIEFDFSNRSSIVLEKLWSVKINDYLRLNEEHFIGFTHYSRRSIELELHVNTGNHE